MKKLYLKKHRNRSIVCGLLLICVILLGVMMQNPIGLLALVLGGIGFGAVIAYDLYVLLTYPKKCKDLVPSEGVIANWQLSGHRSYWGSVSVKVVGREYRSPSYFATDAAQAMVGQKVSYVIFEDTLLIYEILNG